MDVGCGWGQGGIGSESYARVSRVSTCGRVGFGYRLQRGTTDWLLDPTVHMFPCREYVAAVSRHYARYVRVCIRSVGHWL